MARLPKTHGGPDMAFVLCVVMVSLESASSFVAFRATLDLFFSVADIVRLTDVWIQARARTLEGVLLPIVITYWSPCRLGVPWLPLEPTVAYARRIGTVLEKRYSPTV
jgi:hypothetical protein